MSASATRATRGMARLGEAAQSNAPTIDNLAPTLGMAPHGRAVLGSARQRSAPHRPSDTPDAARGKAGLGTAKQRTASTTSASASLGEAAQRVAPQRSAAPRGASHRIDTTPAAQGKAPRGSAKQRTDYSGRAGTRMSDKDATTLGPIFARLAEEHRLTPNDVVNEARSAESPLHRYFIWEDARAAHLYRLDMARHLIRSISVKTEEVTVRAFYHMDEASQDEARYIPVADVLSDPERLGRVLATFTAKIASLRREYGYLRTLAGAEKVATVLTAIDQALADEAAVAA